MRAMQILMLSDNYVPEMNANARIFSEIAELWAEKNQEVTVITCHPNFPKGKLFKGYKNKWVNKERINNVNVTRVKTYMYPNKGLFRRSLDFISFGFAALLCGLFQKKTDVVVAVTPQFFCGIAGCCLAIIKRVPFVLVLCDLWPDSIVANGIIGDGFLYGLIKKFERWMYYKADTVVVLSEYFKPYLINLGVDEQKILVSIAGANKQFYPREKAPSILSRYGLTNKFVVGYVGTFGVSHNHEDILVVAKSLKKSNREDISFFMIGDGIKREQLVTQSQFDLNTVIIDGPFPCDVIPDYWSVVDVAIVPLALTQTNETVLPSKILEAMAMGIPVILYAPDGEAKKVLQKSGTGWSIQAGDMVGLESLLLELTANKELILKQQAQVTEFTQQYTREKQSTQLLERLRTICNQHQSVSKVYERTF